MTVGRGPTLKSACLAQVEPDPDCSDDGPNSERWACRECSERAGLGFREWGTAGSGCLGQGGEFPHPRPAVIPALSSRGLPTWPELGRSALWPCAVQESCCFVVNFSVVGSHPAVTLDWEPSTGKLCLPAFVILLLPVICNFAF